MATARGLALSRLQAALSLRPSVLGAEFQSHLNRPWHRARREPPPTRVHTHTCTLTCRRGMTLAGYKATIRQNWEIPTQRSPFPGSWWPSVCPFLCLALFSAHLSILPGCFLPHLCLCALLLVPICGSSPSTRVPSLCPALPHLFGPLSVCSPRGQVLSLSSLSWQTGRWGSFWSLFPVLDALRTIGVGSRLPVPHVWICLPSPSPQWPGRGGGHLTLHPASGAPTAGGAALSLHCGPSLTATPLCGQGAKGANPRAFTQASLSCRRPRRWSALPQADLLRCDLRPPCSAACCCLWESPVTAVAGEVPRAVLASGQGGRRRRGERLGGSPPPKPAGGELSQGTVAPQM